MQSAQHSTSNYCCLILYEKTISLVISKSFTCKQATGLQMFINNITTSHKLFRIFCLTRKLEKNALQLNNTRVHQYLKREIHSIMLINLGNPAQIGIIVRFHLDKSRM